MCGKSISTSAVVGGVTYVFTYVHTYTCTYKERRKINDYDF